MKKLGCKIRFQKTVDLRHTPKEYNYLTDIEDLKNGDMIVVHANNDYVVAYFSSYDESVTEKNASKWIVDKVNLENHYERIAKMQKAIIIKEKLQKEAEKAKELELYEILAKNNPTIAALLNELKGLDI